VRDAVLLRDRNSSGGDFMSRKDGVLLASRTLALLLTIWALAEAANLPGSAYSFLRYNSDNLGSTATLYWRHYHLIGMGFLITRIVGFSLIARWLYKGGSEVGELLLPSDLVENTVQN
jgi:hypothetical protein